MPVTTRPKEGKPVPAAKPNMIVVVSDTLRTAFLGCYGNSDIRTPNIDRFAGESALFTQAYPESLPTIPVRRTLHSGRRAYPFRDYRPVRWDIVYLPGWQPMSNDEDTVAENLYEAGYHTGFVSDTLPYFAPGLNFTRGFAQWEFIRGQQQDRWRSPHSPTDADLDARYTRPWGSDDEKDMYRQVLANMRWQEHEEDTSTARTFQWAMDFATDNRNVPFYLFVDCFDPHEPWEAPEEYYEMYRPEGYDGSLMPFVRYTFRDEFCTQAELDNTVAHYKGLVTLVDTWFGKLVDRLRSLGLYEDSVLVLLSDHGTNFADNPELVVGKPAWGLYPGTMHLPLLVHLPGGHGGGQRLDGLVSNLDVPATMCDVAGVYSPDGLDGQSLRPIIAGDATTKWDYLTSRYGNTVWYRDGERWIFCSVRGEERRVFRLGEDDELLPTSEREADEMFDVAWQRILDDAGGELPDYTDWKRTDAVGQKDR